MEAFGSRFIEATFGIPGSSLHYWDRNDLVRPSVRPAAGRGSKRLYSFADLVRLLVLARSREMGISLPRIRRSLEFLRRRAPDLGAVPAGASLLTDGEGVFVLSDDTAKALATLREQSLWSLPVGAWVRSARDAIQAATALRQESLVIAGHRVTVAMEQDPEDGWWIGLVRELPGCGSQGGTLDELREMVADAVREYLIARGDITADGDQPAAPKARQTAAV
jgi:DNA-binding transcriptional MerR regulator